MVTVAELDRQATASALFMTDTFTQRGGIRIGKDFNASWPFAHLTITPQQMLLSCFNHRYSFPRESIQRLSRHHGWFSVGLRIEHSVPTYPGFLVFWTFKFAALKGQLQELGYAVDDDVA